TRGRAGVHAASSRLGARGRHFLTSNRASLADASRGRDETLAHGSPISSRPTDSRACQWPVSSSARLRRTESGIAHDPQRGEQRDGRQLARPPSREKNSINNRQGAARPAPRWETAGPKTQKEKAVRLSYGAESTS